MVNFWCQILNTFWLVIGIRNDSLNECFSLANFFLDKEVSCFALKDCTLAYHRGQSTENVKPFEDNLHYAE